MYFMSYIKKLPTSRNVVFTTRKTQLSILDTFRTWGTHAYHRTTWTLLNFFPYFHLSMVQR